MANTELKIKHGGEISTVSAIETPGQGKLNKRDWLIGLGMAIITPVLASMYDLLMQWLDYQPVQIDWRMLAKMGISAGVAYIGKNLFDKKKIVILKEDLK